MRADCIERPTLAILNGDLMEEIFLRLPARSLVQLRGVCSSWNAIISSPQFAKFHNQRLMAAPSLIHYRMAYTCHYERVCRLGICSVQSVLENYPSTPTNAFCSRIHAFTQIMGHCNGLLCLYNMKNKSVKLFNPLVGLSSEWLQIERTQTCPLIMNRGFGYDHVHDKYKLHLACREEAGGGTQTVTKVCTFGANSTWKFTQNICPFPPFDFHGKFVSGRGTLNWIDTRSWVIIFFDLVSETYGQLSMPRERPADCPAGATLNVLRNSLCACILPDKIRWNVWLMKEYGDEQSWTKLATFSLTFPSLCIIKPLYMSEHGIVLTFAQSRGLLYCDSTDNNQVEQPVLFVDKYSDGSLEYPNVHMLSGRCYHTYHESLISPSHLGLPISNMLDYIQF